MRKLLLIAAALLAASGCSAGRHKTAAEAAVAQFHQMVNAEQYREIYQASASELKSVTSEEQLTGLLQSIHDRLGNSGAATQRGWNVTVSNGVSMVNLNYETQFANGTATENFVYRVDNGAPSLAGYHVNSPDAPAAAPTGDK